MFFFSKIAFENVFFFLQIQKSVSARMEYNTKLEQDDMEGVDETEWQD